MALKSLSTAIVSIMGGPGYSVDDEDEEWMSSAIRRHDYEYTLCRPFCEREFWIDAVDS
jgi:hypothetical protein